MRRRPVVLVLVALLAVTVGVLPGVATLLADLWWFREIGTVTVFAWSFLLRWGLFLGVGAAVFAFIAINIRIASRGLAVVPKVIIVDPNRPHVDLSGLPRRFVTPLALLVAFVAALSSSAGWLSVVRYVNQVPFHRVDPIFGRDIAFYLFTLPIVDGTLTLVRTVVTIAALACGLSYWARGDIHFTRGRFIVAPDASVHLGVLIGTWFIVTAATLWFVEIPSLLYSTTGPLLGASYTDLHATLPALRVLAVVAAVAGLMVFAMAPRRLGVATIGAVTVYLLVAGVGTWLYPELLQKLIVAPNEVTRETPQLRDYIRATRQAWGIDGVQERELNGEASLTAQDLRANAVTVDNIRLWDRAPLLQTFGALQEIRTYYDFVSLDDDRYVVDGKYRQILLSPRELNPASLPTQTFINTHLTFTHGMGVTAAPVNQVTDEGLPTLLIKDLPPATTTSLRITKPQIYYGETSDEFAIVNTAQREFDYPSGDVNVFTHYAGTGGVPIGSFFSRLVMALEFGSLKILLSDDIRPGSRILYNRAILTRAAKALPFLTFDHDPYIVIDRAGALYWLLDAYTESSDYPYAARTEDRTNYMRNSVKVVISAYDGSMRAYITDATDPLIQTYARAFPGIFQPIAAMPADLRAHVRYPTDLFRIQTSLYTTYHMDDPQAFYLREDQWQIPAQTGGDGTSSEPFMRHMIMRLPDERNAEYIYMAPFTPRGKDNLAAWMVARNDGVNYGQLRVYRFPKNSLVYGPGQIVSRINQETDISRQLTLWDQRGSKVIWGELLVIPIEKALLYVQPLYLRAEGGRIPEFKRVVMAYRDHVVMAETLEGALDALFGDSATAVRDSVVAKSGPGARPGLPPATDGLGPLAREAREHYDRAIAAQRNGDWATYGAELQQLGEVLKRMGNR